MRKVSNEKTGRISGIVAKAAAGAMAALVAGTALTAVPYNVLADEVIAEWREENGVKYWYENGVRQGVKYREDGSIDASYRGKEIYDPSSNAWYWLDCVQNGAVAKDKDVYQESQADDAGNIGKWVRYDADGHMVKGWSEKNGNRYYFDLVYGTMAKGDVDIDGVHYYFNKDTGILESGGQTDDDGRSFNEDGWHKVDGVNYWYENGVRQGVKYREDGSIDASYRGKEIYDPSSSAWYWLDCVQNGAIAKDKDVYQESQADDAGNIGKWVRYDADGHMVKGWNEKDGSRYYFDPVYGTMAKGTVNIDGKKYTFDETTGAFQSESTEVVYSIKWINGICKASANGVVDESYSGVIDYSRYKYTFVDGKLTKLVYYNADGSISFWEVYEYDADGNNIKKTVYQKDGKIGSIYEYEYNGNQKIKSTEYCSDGSLRKVIEYGSNQIKIKESLYSQGGVLYSVTEYSATGKKSKVTYYGASDSTGVRPVVNEYDDSEKLIKSTQYNSDGSIGYWYIYEYSENSMTETRFNADGTPWNEWVYEYDASGRTVKSSSYSYYSDGTRHLGFWTEYAYDAAGNTIKSITYWVEYNTYYYYDEKDSAGNIVKRVHCRLSDGSLYYCEEYNIDGNVEKELRYDEAGNLDKWTIYTYDSQGRKKEATTYKADGSLYSITTYTYVDSNSYLSTKYY